jgi:hypothetical protein
MKSAPVSSALPLSHTAICSQDDDTMVVVFWPLYAPSSPEERQGMRLLPPQMVVTTNVFNLEFMSVLLVRVFIILFSS